MTFEEGETVWLFNHHFGVTLFVEGGNVTTVCSNEISISYMLNGKITTLTYGREDFLWNFSFQQRNISNIIEITRIIDVLFWRYKRGQMTEISWEYFMKALEVVQETIWIKCISYIFIILVCYICSE